MTHMKHILTVLALLVAFVSCNERPVVVRDTIPYVKQLAADTTGIFRLVHTYRTAGTKGSIAVIGEPEAAARLASAFLNADRVDNIDGHSSQDRLPDFAHRWRNAAADGGPEIIENLTLYFIQWFHNAPPVVLAGQRTRTFDFF